VGSTLNPPLGTPLRTSGSNCGAAVQKQTVQGDVLAYWSGHRQTGVTTINIQSTDWCVIGCYGN